jgi:hypothetical protein
MERVRAFTPRAPSAPLPHYRSHRILARAVEGLPRETLRARYGVYSKIATARWRSHCLARLSGCSGVLLHRETGLSPDREFRNTRRS